MKNVPNSSQKSRDRTPSPSAAIAAAAGLARVADRSASAGVPPNGARPTSLGWSRMNSATIGIINAAAPATIHTAQRQP
jgi:hypothetical protein